MCEALDDHEGSVSIGERLITSIRFAADIVVNAEEEEEAMTQTRTWIGSLTFPNLGVYGINFANAYKYINIFFLIFDFSFVSQPPIFLQ